jgi:23S rRNA pseudouridine2457 synthase
VIQGRKTLPCVVRMLDPQPDVPPRSPPIRFRKTVPACWLSLQLIEGKNRQVRKMTATIGHPTLRLIRVRIGGFRLGNMALGTWQALDEVDRSKLLALQDTR